MKCCNPNLCGVFPNCVGLAQNEIAFKTYWFVANCGSEIGNASKYNRSLAEQKHLCYMGTSQILMPENYIAMFDAPQAEE